MMQKNQECPVHSKELVYLCLAQECKESFLLCSDCKDQNRHKHSKTDIVAIKEIQDKLKNQWELKDSPIDPYFKKATMFFDSLKKEVTKLIEEDQKAVEQFLTKIKYHHLPVEADSHVYMEFIKQQYERLDKAGILKLINEAESSELNKNLDSQKNIMNFLDVELKKVKDKVLTLKYVLLSKKMENQLLSPNLSEESKIANVDEFTKIYCLFNSRSMLIRSAKLIYRGSENKFSPKGFHNRCNGVTNCLAMVKTANNKLVGGYTPIPLVHHDEDELSEEEHYEGDNTKRSFIFSISNLKSFSIKDSSKAIRYRKEWPGPCFGSDLDIGKVVTSSIGNSYESIEGVGVDSLQAKVYLLEVDKADIKDLEVWQLSF